MKNTMKQMLGTAALWAVAFGMIGSGGAKQIRYDQTQPAHGCKKQL